MIQYPNWDPIALAIGPLQIHWYGLAYLAGIALGFIYAFRPLRDHLKCTKDDVSNLLTTIMLSIFIGGRLGYVLFYDPIYFLTNPTKIIAIWNGGMSFHGGLIGVGVGCLWFAKTYKKNLWRLSDIVCISAPIGIFFGRLANFINGELYGRMTTSPFGMIFPGGGPFPRHPSQLYEALLEGLILWIILGIIYKKDILKPGQLTGLFILSYGIIRTIIENFREPDAHLGTLAMGLTMGQYLSVTMVIVGLGLIIYFKNTPKPT